jgi:hypothetical protein
MALADFENVDLPEKSSKDELKARAAELNK